MRVLTKRNGGPASARNLGLAQSHAEIVAFIDADCRAAPNWLSSLVRLLSETNAAAVGGPIVNANSTNWVASYHQRERPVSSSYASGESGLSADRQRCFSPLGSTGDGWF